MACQSRIGAVLDPKLRHECLFIILLSNLDPSTGLVRGKSILEFGSGVGLLGLIIAALQSSDTQDIGRIKLTDVNALVLQRCEDNLALACSKYPPRPPSQTKLILEFIRPVFSASRHSNGRIRLDGLFA